MNNVKQNIEIIKETLFIGITGGIGSGKTEVAKIFQQNGFPVIFTDELAKKIVNENPEIKNKITEYFGEESYFDGKYNAKFISKCVFNGENSQKKLQKLNQIVHPKVIEEIIFELENLQKESEKKMIFVETALLFELNLEEGFDYIISVSTSENVKIQRVMNRTGLNEVEIKARISSQISQEEKNKFSDFVIENDKNLDELKKSVEFLIPIISALPNKKND
jgi:dephospho-CoA kinase